MPDITIESLARAAKLIEEESLIEKTPSIISQDNLSEAGRKRLLELRSLAIQPIKTKPQIKRPKTRNLASQQESYALILDAIRKNPWHLFNYSSIADYLKADRRTLQRHINYLYSIGRITPKEFNFGQMSAIKSTSTDLLNQDFNPDNRRSR